MCVSASVCVSFQAYTRGPIGTKFGTHMYADSPRKGSGQNKNLPRVT